MEQPDAEGFETVAQERVQPYQGLMPSAQDYTTAAIPGLETSAELNVI
jgi:hypothetical protein